MKNWWLTCTLALTACDDGANSSIPPIELDAMVDAAIDAQTADMAGPLDSQVDAAVDMNAPDQSINATRAAQIEALYAPWVDAAFFPSVSVALVTPDQVEFVSLGALSGPDTLYEIGSLSKVFTGLLLAEMVQAEQVALDTSIGDLLPAAVVLPESTAAITLQSLTTHRSGLPRLADNMPFGDPTDPYADYGTDGMYAFLQGFEAPDNPLFAYSNLGVGLLGHVLGRAAGADSWAAALHDRVLDPLGMTDTGVEPVDPARLIAGHDADARPVPPWFFTDASAAAGALRSNVRDLARFAQAQMTPTGPLADAIRTSQQPLADISPDTQMGHGWFLIGPENALYHDGGTGGFVAFLAIDLDTQRALIALHNGSSAIANTLGWLAFQHWKGEAVEAPQPPAEVALTSEQQATLAGTYRGLAGEMVVRHADDRLFVRLGAQPEFGIYALSAVEFYLRVVEARLRFTVLGGTATAVTLLQDGREIRFDRQN